MDEQQNVVGIAAEIEDGDAAVQSLTQRVDALEQALSELRNVSASGAGGRKTVVSVSANEHTAALDAALSSLSLEQRIAVKSQMLRSGLL